MDPREVRQWANTGLILVMTVGWLVYAGWSVLEKRRTDRAIATFRAEVARRGEYRWEADHDATGAPGIAAVPNPYP